ncbi:MAG: DUF3047 domain-containing protein [bacterium]|nr:DUF3047 domain-containing protein [bacterium]
MNKSKLISISAITVFLVFCVIINTATSENESILLENFEKYSQGNRLPRKFLKTWRTRKNEPHNTSKIYHIKSENGNKYLHGTTKGNSGLSIQIGKQVNEYSFFKRNKVSWDIRKHPYISWRWRLHETPKGASELKRSKTDSAAGIYVLTQKVNIPFVSWKYQPVNVIKYVWSSSVPKGHRIIHRNFKRFGLSLFHVTYIVLESGESKKGKWLTVKRNVLNDYRKCFGSNPKYSPIMIGILTDSNNVRGTARADYDDIVVSKK